MMAGIVNTVAAQIMLPNVCQLTCKLFSYAVRLVKKSRVFNARSKS